MKSGLLSTNQKQNTSVKMSSIEIAQLCEKRHDNVMTDIRKMLDELNLYAPDFSGTYKTAQGNEYQCFFLPKRETMILISGYRIDLRAKIIDRLDELERGIALPNFNDPVASARAWADAKESELRALAAEQAALAKIERDAPKVAFVDHYVEVGTTKSLRETAKILKMSERAMINRLIEDKLLYRQSGNILPYQTAQARDLFTVKTGTAEHGHNFTQTRVTAKGIELIASRYASELMQ